MARWRKLGWSASVLRCDTTLINGQTFGWRQAHAPAKTGAAATLKSLPKGSAKRAAKTKRVECDSNLLKEWTGVVEGHVISLRQEKKDTLVCEHYPGTSTPSVLDEKLQDYFSLRAGVPPLSELYQQWSEKDPHFAALGAHLPGLRILRQDPVECLFSFLCSSNNHISRITKMLEALRVNYGTFLCKHQGSEYFSFPTVEALATKATEERLRQLGFGYRAKFVVQAAKQVHDNGGKKWLLSLRSKKRSEVQEELCKLMGVGRKVADCVALFSLDQLSVVPVDTHVHQIALRDYQSNLPDLDAKAMSKKTYEQVGNFFRDHFGEHAGWAHSVLFVADLPAFAHFLPEKLRPVPMPKKTKPKKPSPKKKPSQKQVDESQPDKGKRGKKVAQGRVGEAKIVGTGKQSKAKKRKKEAPKTVNTGTAIAEPKANTRKRRKRDP